MKSSARTRVTLSLSSDLVRLLDARSKRQGLTRSGLVERLLTDKERANEKETLQASVVAYYSSEPTGDDLQLGNELRRAARARPKKGARSRGKTK